LARGGGWLPAHPDRELIARRYLKNQRTLARDALARLSSEDGSDPEERAEHADAEESLIERPLSLNEQRMGAVLGVLKASGATSVLDLGCGEGTLLRDLVKERQFERIVGMDVSVRSLERASERLK